MSKLEPSWPLSKSREDKNHRHHELHFSPPKFYATIDGIAMINAFPPYKLPNMPIRQGDSSLPSWSINYSTPAGAARPSPGLLPTSSSTASHFPLTTWAITAPPIASCTTIPVDDVFYYLYLYPPPLEKITECNCKNMQYPTYQSGRRGGPTSSEGTHQSHKYYTTISWATVLLDDGEGSYILSKFWF